MYAPWPCFSPFLNSPSYLSPLDQVKTPRLWYLQSLNQPSYLFPLVNVSVPWPFWSPFFHSPSYLLPSGQVNVPRPCANPFSISPSYFPSLSSSPSSYHLNSPFTKRRNKTFFCPFFSAKIVFPFFPLANFSINFFNFSFSSIVLHLSHIFVSILL